MDVPGSEGEQLLLSNSLLRVWIALPIKPYGFTSRAKFFLAGPWRWRTPGPRKRSMTSGNKCVTTTSQMGNTRLSYHPTLGTLASLNPWQRGSTACHDKHLCALWQTTVAERSQSGRTHPFRPQWWSIQSTFTHVFSLSGPISRRGDGRTNVLETTGLARGNL